ncbi:Phosphoglucomutase, first 3 domain-containing protein [Violaceomyces palustris]|uniref:Phosphoglucomutase, first 3 domain-containing protein n=1 Tax=Violaceomyces palustris TaxID=1673888 RepID=A0ACD0NXK1_9BASI|nr:Phosphoglucomutase, first 3 domain-containing protein [Violaceomyces palustris]
MSEQQQEQLLAKAKAWLEKDPDPTTKRQLSKIIEDQDYQSLTKCFAERLEFGTAGLRGVMGLGWSNMNLLVVLETTAGLARYLLQSDPDKARSKGVAIAYDGRYGSKEFAQESASHFASLSIPCHLYPVPTPTPMCGYAVKKLGLAGGIVVTASHNPKEYNGYKVYGPAGTQINTPIDSMIADQILEVAKETQLPSLMPLDEAKSNGLVQIVQEDMFQSYIRDLEEVGIFKQQRSSPTPPIKVAYTPLHGVGAQSVEVLMSYAGFEEGKDWWIVEDQRKPDGGFPTLEFPNPEEASTLAMVHDLSDKHGTDLAIANDPDADRLAVSARDSHGKLRQLTGDQLGTLLGDEMLRRAASTGVESRTWTLSTIVSSRLLARLSKSYGAKHVETLTGFKWLGNVAKGIEEREGKGSFAFGYEEALGYMCSRSVWDKDGLSALLLTLSLAMDLASEKGGRRTLWDRLEEIHRRVGVSVTKQKIIKLSPGRKGTEVMDKLRRELEEDGKSSVASKDGKKEFSFSLVDDLISRPKFDLDKAEMGDLSIPKNDVLRFYVPSSEVRSTESREEEDITLSDTRVIVRPSGTEPKVKIYTESLGHIRDGEDYVKALERVDGELDEVVDAFWEWMSS